MPLELAGHAQMNAPDTAGLEGVGVMEGGHQIFATTGPFADALPLEAIAERIDSSRAGHSPFPKYFNLLNHKRVKTARQSPANRLNFRKFRQDSGGLEFGHREVVGVDATVGALQAVVVDLFKADHNGVADSGGVNGRHLAHFVEPERLRALDAHHVTAGDRHRCAGTRLHAERIAVPPIQGLSDTQCRPALDGRVVCRGSIQPSVRC